ncbi:hypothetical protein E2562_016061 [Oryza meyeriana var. granulata]|uniref:Uncharacterized protein n=1 Tax=Oryza meyeriana var. granulata TaxID=110450 RepID=A0A6G1BL48_9ORYZ|nr:hypothetical protein E2562_016061 [Oryza meyeriana var. granulata]
MARQLLGHDKAGGKPGGSLSAAGTGGFGATRELQGRQRRCAGDVGRARQLAHGGGFSRWWRQFAEQ